MFKRTFCALLTFGALATACYSGADATADRGLVITAEDLAELPAGESLVIDLQAPDASVRFDLSDGPIDLDRVVILQPEGGEILLQDLIGLYGEALGADLIGDGELTLASRDLGELASVAAAFDDFPVLLPSQSAALSRLPQIDRISLDKRALPRVIRGDLGTLSGDAASGAVDFIHGIAPAFRFGEGHDVEVVRVEEDDLGQVHVRVQLYIDALPVIGAQAIVHADRVSGVINGLNSQLAPLRAVDDDRALLEGDAAITAASAALEGEGFEITDAVDLVYVVVDGRPVLAYAAPVAYTGEDGPEVDVVFADARSGELLTRHPQIHRAKSRKVYSANNGQSLPGSQKMSEGAGNNSDPVVQAAYDNSGLTYDYYKAKFGRDSFNNAGATLHSTVHYAKNYDNAFWNGQQMVYGDGGSYFEPLAYSTDIVVHELTHAVTSYSADLVYQNESGALNEAFSDIFAASAQAWVAGGVSSATWMLAEDVWKGGGSAMRFMNDPIADGQSYDYYPTRYQGSQDNGGVHLNSGIANLAYKLAVTGGTHPRGKTNVSVPGIGVAKAEQIFYRALTTYLSSYSDFEDARNATAQAAQDLYGATEAAAIHKAWDAVGVPGTPQNDDPPPQDDPPQDDPPADTCAGVPYGGSLSGSGAQQFQPNGNYYYSKKSGTHKGCMTGPASADFDLYLWKWSGNSWSVVAKSESPTSSESISYSGTPGYYVWRAYSYSGSGSYNVGLTTP
ncbi:MAG: M4 family metallopeptidase [Nannocystaceae bacterium]